MTTGPVDGRDFSTLTDWVDGRLDPDRAAQVAAQVAQADPRTRAIVEWLRGFVEIGRQFPLEEPPPDVRQRLKEHFAHWRESELALAAEIRRFDATVMFDSRARPSLVGTRGAVADEVFHLAYTTEVADLVLDVQRMAGHQVRIDGQVLVADVDRSSAFEASVSGPETHRTVAADRLGRFRLDALPEDIRELRVTDDEIMVTVPLDLTADEP